MLVHSVYFWLKEDLSQEQMGDFRAGLETLAKIASAEAVYIGTPAATPERPVIDTSYSFALTVLVTDLAAQDAYQVDALHKAFVENFASYWDRVQIYDAD